MLNADGMVADIGQVQGYNLFAYCFNNPVNMFDDDGLWPKWLSGALTVMSGAASVVAGAAICATVGWTGIGAVVGSAIV